MRCIIVHKKMQNMGKKYSVDYQYCNYNSSENIKLAVFSWAYRIRMRNKKWENGKGTTFKDRKSPVKPVKILYRYNFSPLISHFPFPLPILRL